MNHPKHMWLCFLFLLSTSVEVQAHRVNISHSIWHAWPAKGAVEITVRIAPADIQQILLRTPGTLPQPMAPTSEQWQKHAQQLLSDQMDGSNAEQLCKLQVLDARLEHDLVVRFRWLCPPPLSHFVAQLQWLKTLPASHRHQLRAYKGGNIAQENTLSAEQNTHQWSFEPTADERKPTPPIRPTPSATEDVQPTLLSGLTQGLTQLFLSGYPLLFALGLLLTRQTAKQLVQITLVWNASLILSVGTVALTSVDSSLSFLSMTAASTVAVIAFFNIRFQHSHWRTSLVFLLGLLHGVDLHDQYTPLHTTERDWSPVAGYMLTILAGQWLTIGGLYPVFRRMQNTTHWQRVRIISAVLISVAGLLWGSHQWCGL